MNDDTVPLYPDANSSIQKMGTMAQASAPAQNPAQSTSAISMQFARMTLLLGPGNTVTTCPFCQTSVKTTIKHSTTTRTHMTAVLCSFICCCCCIPYCCDSARNTDHYCPSCLRYLGTYEK